MFFCPIFFIFLIETSFFYVFVKTLFLPKHFFIWRNFIWRTSFGETSFGELIWQNFIWRRLATPIHSLASPGLTLATPVVLIFSNGWTNRHTHAQLYYRYCIPVVQSCPVTMWSDEFLILSYLHLKPASNFYFYWSIHTSV